MRGRVLGKQNGKKKRTVPAITGLRQWSVHGAWKDRRVVHTSPGRTMTARFTDFVSSPLVWNAGYMQLRLTELVEKRNEYTLFWHPCQSREPSRDTTWRQVYRGAHPILDQVHH